MSLNSYVEILVGFGLVTALILWIVISVAWSRKLQRIVAVGVQKSFDGSTHVIPGEGHVTAEDCMCVPSVAGLHGQRFVEHQPLRSMQR